MPSSAIHPLPLRPLKLTDRIQVSILRLISPDHDISGSSSYVRSSALQDVLPVHEFPTTGAIVDFGCGTGRDVISLAQLGCTNVIGVDTDSRRIEQAREAAAQLGVAAQCNFMTSIPSSTADVIISIDAMEHFTDPEGVLNEWSRILKPGGRVYVSFGWSWWHPRGGHDFSIFPWAHLLFSEAALCEWRSRWHWDNARRFTDIDGGLNKMTIARFRRLVSESPLTLQRLELTPIRPLRWLHSRVTEEFTTAKLFAVLHR